MEINREWKTKSGKQVKVIGNLITEKNINADGQNIEVKTCEINLNVTVDGKRMGGFISKLPSQTVKDGITYTHRIGNMALTIDKVEIINNVRAELEATPEWVAKQAQIEKGKKELAEYETEQIKNGLCPICGSYCYGDCTAN